MGHNEPKRVYLRNSTYIIWEPGETCPHYSLKKAFFDFINNPRFPDNPGPNAKLKSSKNQRDGPGPGMYKNNVLGTKANKNNDSSSEIYVNHVPVSIAEENRPYHS